MGESIATVPDKNEVSNPSRSENKPKRGVDLVTVKPRTPYQYALDRINKKANVKALVEDDYIYCLEHIIERDFFPDLPLLRANKEIRQSGGDPYTKQKVLQELEAARNNNKVKVERADGTFEYINLTSLSEFHENYTSEDNKSYDALLVSNIAKRNLEDSWIEHKEIEHNKDMNKIQELTNKGKKSDNLSYNMYRSRTNLMFKPELLNKKDFPVPAAINRENCRINQSHIDNLIDAHTAHKEIVQQNKADQANRDNIAIHGIHASKNPNDPEYLYTPKIVAGETVDASPLITWGTVGQVDEIKEVEATPFNLPSISERDDIASKLRLKHILPKSKSKLLKKKPGFLKSILAKSAASSIDLQLRKAYSGRSRASGTSAYSAMATPLDTSLRDDPEEN